MGILYKKDVPYNLRSHDLCIVPSMNSQHYGISSLSYRGNRLWNALCDEIKLATSINNFFKKYETGMERIVLATSAHNEHLFLVCALLF